MKIRQEIWSPGKGWSTVHEKGSLHQANIVFCHGNAGSNIPGSLYWEIKHAFPNAPLIFTLSKKSKDSNLYLSALYLEKCSFSILSFNNKTGKMDTIPGYDNAKPNSKQIKQLLLCSGLSADAEHHLEKQLYQQQPFSSLERSEGEPVFSVGLNQLPLMPTAIGIAFHDDHLKIHTKSVEPKTFAGAQSAAVQALPMPISLQFIESGDNRVASLPITYTFLLKR